MANVRIERLHKEFRGAGGIVHALADLTLDIADGEFISLVGPSGCGKTTALRIIAGLETPTSGRILFDGRDITRLEPRDRNIAMVFQSYALYPHMTVRQNLEYGLRKRGAPRDERARKVAAIAAMLRIEPMLDRRPLQLSGGQRQRVALGRALIRDPEVFLLDEPLSNLDAKLRVHMRAELAALHQKVRTTMVYVTHDQLEAMTLSDRIVVMNHGVMQQVGRPEEIYSRPANRFVAEFIGTPSMNMIEGQVRTEAGRPLFTGPGITVVLPRDAPQALPSSGRATLGIRPEHVSLVAPDAPGAIPARVTVSELAGPERFHFVAVEGGSIIVRTPAATVLHPGETVALGFDPDRLHLFDGTGEDAPALR
ncbi:ABC transporter ATP-binding protein [Caldovatus sediminis]|uniref:ABC transporter ATP-binding protein n=1 Tax=Caldovatus sediminis TaxID=2041189 RepID=A0A8J3EF00_9PROT|nr:sn-glycerol-3-phosphate ABC transporter ATP-binding protein UgpC [Caldovatus sediminis]GGG48504.1 ABC transporter ATP-binding protein [Caldovatus sediminis]